MLGVYNNMVVGLALTGAVALGVHMLAVDRPARSCRRQDRQYLLLTSFGVALYTSPLKYLVMLAPLAFVFFFSFRINRISASAARGVISCLRGVMGRRYRPCSCLSIHGSIVHAFFVTAAAFGGLSLYGYTTRRDLAPMGAFMFMGLIGLVIA